MSHTISTEQFEGPLGVLLELVERNKLEVTAISVAGVTSQYLQQIGHLKEQSPEALGEFLGLGARLLYIKSLALLPQAKPDEQIEELRQLNLELEEYRRFQAAALVLGRRTKHPTWERPVALQLNQDDLPMPDVSLQQLAATFARVLQSQTVPPEEQLIRQPISLQEVLAKLRERLPEGFKLQSMLEEAHDQDEIVVMFLALLELIREGAAHVSQTNTFAPILVEAARG